MVELTIGIAAIAGLGSFLAPCILPMIPAFLAYISGTTLTEIQRNNGTINVVTSRINIILNTLFFVAGFTIVFSVLGVILNSVLAASATSLLAGFNHVGGIIIIAFGVFMLLSSKISKLNFEKKILPNRTKSSLSSFICVWPSICNRLDSMHRTNPWEYFDTCCYYSKPCIHSTT